MKLLKLFLALVVLHCSFSIFAQSTFRDTLITKIICEGDEFEGFTETGNYLDTIVINGVNFIRTLELETVPFESLTCPTNNTFQIPEGFTHISVEDRPIRPIVLASECRSLVQEEITGPPILDDNILELGTTNFNYTFQNPLVTESCAYSIQVLNGALAENTMGLSVSDTSAIENETVCLDITVTNVEALVAFAHFLSWDADILEFVEVKNLERLEGLDFRLTDPDRLIFIYLSGNIINGLALEDGERLLSVCFRTKKIGTTPVTFFSGNNNIMEFITPEPDILNVALKNGLVTVTGAACNNIMTENNITICEGENFGGRTEAGIYRDTFPLANGCDSTDIINLTVLTTIESVQDISICEGETFEGRTEAGTYQDMFTAQNGCDSIQTLNLTVLATIESVQDVSICEGEAFEGRTEAGIYEDRFTAISGCDSIVTTNLTVFSTAQTSIAASICEGESLNGWTTDGLYIDTLKTNTGCDSIVFTELTILPASDSTCATITSTNDAIALNLLTLYPNPVNEYITLKWFHVKDVIFSIYTITGQKIQATTILNGQTEIDVSGFKSGVYNVKIIDGEKVYYAKFIKM